MLRPAAMVLGLAVGCACAPTPEDQRLSLEVDATALEPRLAELGALSVEVYGLRETTTLCTLARRCLYPVDLGSPSSSDDLQAALRQVEPLVEVDASLAHQLAVVGRPGGLCDERGPFLACGFADLATARDGALTVVVAEGQCPESLPVFCPQ